MRCWYCSCQHQNLSSFKIKSLQILRDRKKKKISDKSNKRKWQVPYQRLAKAFKHQCGVLRWEREMILAFQVDLLCLLLLLKDLVCILCLFFLLANISLCFLSTRNLTDKINALFSVFCTIATVTCVFLLLLI